jgi:hypothetical protein
MSDEYTGTPESEEQPSHDGADSQHENNGGGEEPLASFLDAYDLGEVDDPQARAVAESFVKRVNAGYTRQRQEDTQAIRDAQQAQTIVDGLMDPRSQAEVARLLGLQLAQEEADDELDEDFELRDPRYDALKAEFDQDRSVRLAEQRQQLENQYITGEVWAIEQELGVEFSEDELDALEALVEQVRDQNGAPDVRGAFRILDAAGSAYHTRASKPRPPKPRAPRRPGGGSAGERTVDLSDPEARREVMLAAARHLRASSE